MNNSFNSCSFILSPSVALSGFLGRLSAMLKHVWHCSRLLAKFVFKKKRNTLSMSLSIFALWLTPQSRLSG